MHQLRTPRGWALDVADLDAAEAMGVTMVHVHDLEALAHYWAATDTIRRKGFDFDRGHGVQVALALEHWQPTRELAEAMAETLQPQAGPRALQGVLL